MNWKIKTLYLYRKNEHYKISQLYEEVFGATGSDGLYVDSDGDKRWYLNGELHRENAPAVEWTNGSKYWYLNDKPHREDGPAVEKANGYKCWYLNGARLNEEEFLRRKK